MSIVKNLPASTRQRLLNKARGMNRPYNEVLQYFVIERFLFRLSQSAYADKFILKGALMFLVWRASLYRPTRDIDLLGFTSNSLEAVVRIIRKVCEQKVEADGITFDAQTVRSERINEDADYDGVRVHLIGYLGKSRIPLQIDIGFSDIVYPDPIKIIYPTLLQISAPLLRGYPPETVIAEKLQALVFLGRVNTRMKDFYDLWVLAEQFEFDGRKLQKAIINTFDRRNTELPKDIPASLSESFAAENQPQWQAFLKRIHINSGPESLLDVVQVLNRFLVQPLHASAARGTFEGVWKSRGPWISSA